MQHYFTLLQYQMRDHWDGLALCNYKGDSYTYGDLACKIEGLHLLFESQNIKKAEKIAVCAKSSATSAIAFLAANTFEAVVVPILSDFLPNSIASLVHHSEAVALIADPDIWSKLDKETMPMLRLVLSAKDFSVLYGPEDTPDAEALLSKRYPQGFSINDVNYPVDNMKDLALINYTSGTSSDPKGVMIRYESLVLNVYYGQKRVPMHFGDTVLSMLPMAHMYGLMFELLFTLTGGVCVYFLGKTPTPKVLLEALANVKPFTIVTVPLVMEKIFKSSILPVLKQSTIRPLLYLPGINNIIFGKIHHQFMTATGGRLRIIILGGAAFNPNVEFWFHKLQIPYMVGYGMTETAPLATFESPELFVKGSCGKAIENCEIRIDSEDPQHVAGEMQIKGMNVMSGYYKNEEATKAAFTSDGWLKSGDLGTMDKNGNVFICGRCKNMILTSNGQNVYPEEIEAEINIQPNVLESLVLDRSGKIVALVHLDKNDMDEEAVADQIELIRTSVNRRLPAYSRIAKVECVDKPFAKTPKMSIKRFLYK